MNTLPPPNRLLKLLDKRVQGQAEAKRALAAAVYRHYTMCNIASSRPGTETGRHHVLLHGPTGCGKTFLVRTLADILGVPFGFSSATSMSEEGYVGDSVESVVRNLLIAADTDPERAAEGIIFIDEIDKIAAVPGGIRDVSGAGVQQALLTLLDGRPSRGTSSDSHRCVDTSKVLFICAGAFVGLDAHIGKKLARAPIIGFASSREAWKDEALPPPSTEDFVAFGMIPEFMGRFRTVAAVHPLEAEDLFELLRHRDDSILAEARLLAEHHGVELQVTDSALRAIAERAFELGTGARGLARELNLVLEPLIHRYPELRSIGPHRVVLDETCVRPGAEPVVERTAGLEPGGTPRFPPPTAVAELTEFDVLGNVSKEASDWWSLFVNQYHNNTSMIDLLKDELRKREATVEELYRSVQASGTDNIQASLHYLDYMRLQDHDRPS